MYGDPYGEPPPMSGGTFTGTEGPDLWFLEQAGTYTFFGLGGTDTLDFGTEPRNHFTIVRLDATTVQVDALSSASAAFHATLHDIEFILFNHRADTLDLNTLPLPNNPPTGAVAVAGTATQGQTLTASNTLADTDGLGTIGYQWKADGTAIGGATDSTLLLAAAQVGKAITVTASYTDGHGTAESVSSNATGPVATESAPTGSVTISGIVAQGQTLTASNTLADADGIGAISYQWEANGTPIGGATGSTLVPAEAQVGKAITVAAIYTDGHGTAESVSSDATGLVVNVNDAPTGAVTISGAATQGQTLTASNTLADADGLGAISYQWKADGTAIAGATSSNLYLGEAMVGKAITVTAGYVDGHGTSEAVTIGASGLVVNVNDAPTGSVAITGTVALGQTLTASNTLADADGLSAIGYQWKANGVPVDVAAGSTFLLTGGQDGQTITVTASYVDGHGTPESVTGSVGKTADFLVYSWKAHTLLDGVSIQGNGHSGTTESNGATSLTGIADTSLALTAGRPIPSAESTATSSAVNLQDAIAILRMIVGLDVNGSGKPLSPYQSLAADFDGNGTIGLSDAIGVLKHVVGLASPEPIWRFVSEADTSVPGKANLNPGAPPAINVDLSTSNQAYAGLAGYLTGDVDGSYAGATGAQDLDNTQPAYFTALVATHTELNLSQFGIYP
jgi:hypothetical protein